MSRAALPQWRDPLVWAWAQSVISDHQKESAEIQAELQPLGGMDTADDSAGQSTPTVFEPDASHHGSINDMARPAAV
jgi:hypothetical protein